MKIEFAAAAEEDILSVAARMCAEDRDELEGLEWSSPLAALRSSVGASLYAIAAKWNGQAEAIFGLAVDDEGTLTGYPWMMGTDAVKANPKDFLKASQVWIAQAAKGRTKLSVLVDTRHIRAMRWLYSLGFRCTAYIDVPASDVPYMEMDRV